MNRLLIMVIVLAVVVYMTHRRNVELDGRLTALVDVVYAIQGGPEELLSPDEKQELEEATTKLAHFSDECVETKNTETDK